MEGTMNTTKIAWTHYFGPNSGATWNPIVAIDTETGKKGNACVKYNTDCKFCYAAHMNKTQAYGYGTGKDYTKKNLETTLFVLSVKGQSSIDWPIRTKKRKGIFPCSMTEWISEFTPIRFTDSIFDVMLHANHHVFFPLTKRAPIMREYLIKKFEKNPVPKNVIFGVTIGCQETADQQMNDLILLKKHVPSIKLWVSHEPATSFVNWNPLKNVIDWLVMGGESQQGLIPPRKLEYDVAVKTQKWCKENSIPFFFKQWNNKRVPPLINGVEHKQFPDLG